MRGPCQTPAEEVVRLELARAFGCEVHIRPRDFLEKTLAGLYGRQPDMSGDQRKRLLPHELAMVGRTTDSLMKALIGLAEITPTDPMSMES
jgi:hypothetical protein